jgi:hypothetical protein
MITRACAVLFLAGLWPAAGADGLTPRDTPADYPVHKVTADNVAIAAALPGRDDLRRFFSAELSRDWLIVEVAVFPGDARVKLKSADFQLEVHDRDAVTFLHPAEPSAVVASARPAREPARFGEPHGSVGYETTIGGNIHSQRAGGAIESSIDQPSPPPLTGGSGELEAELSGRSLPYGLASAPVAGYLYFPLRAKKRSKLHYALKYTSPAGGITLELPAAPR